MQTTNQTISEQKNLLFFIIATGLLFFYLNSINSENYFIFEDYAAFNILFTIFPIPVIIFSAILAFKYKGQGYHGKAWILFLISSVIWFAGEQFFDFENYDIEKIESFTGDFLFIAGYPFFFGFLIFYLKPFAQIITKKNTIASVSLSAGILTFLLYFSLDGKSELELWECVLLAIYPVLDAIMLVPALIGIYMFFTGKVNLMWTLLMMGWILEITGEIFYVGSYIDDSYFTGHISDWFYLWNYIVWSFGLYSYLKIHSGSKLLKMS